jgi:pentatricopeptide repeat protein
LRSRLTYGDQNDALDMSEPEVCVASPEFVLNKFQVTFNSVISVRGRQGRVEDGERVLAELTRL